MWQGGAPPPLMPPHPPIAGRYEVEEEEEDYSGGGYNPPTHPSPYTDNTQYWDAAPPGGEGGLPGGGENDGAGISPLGGGMGGGRPPLLPPTGYNDEPYYNDDPYYGVPPMTGYRDRYMDGTASQYRDRYMSGYRDRYLDSTGYQDRYMEGTGYQDRYMDNSGYRERYSYNDDYNDYPMRGRGRSRPAPYTRGTYKPSHKRALLGHSPYKKPGYAGRGSGGRGAARGSRSRGRGGPRGSYNRSSLSDRKPWVAPPGERGVNPGKDLHIETRLSNLCNHVKNAPRSINPLTAVETYTSYNNVGLNPAFVFKGERGDGDEPFTFDCKVYLNGIFISNGIATNKKMSKSIACSNALFVLRSTPPEKILAGQEVVNISALSKQEADIVESASRDSFHVTSNIVNVMSVTELSQKTLADFFILQPEQVDAATGMNSTCILRQSADFSHMLLKFEFETTNYGYLCAVNLEGKELARATAAQSNQAKNAASHIALQNLRKTNWTILIIKRDKPTVDPSPITSILGRIVDDYSRKLFEQKLVAHLTAVFSSLEDDTCSIPLSSELNRQERDSVYNVAKEMSLRVETKRVDGGRAAPTDADTVFLVISKKMSCQDLFEYVWNKGGETWRYKLRPPQQFKVPPIIKT